MSENFNEDDDDNNNDNSNMHQYNDENLVIDEDSNNSEADDSFAKHQFNYETGIFSDKDKSDLHKTQSNGTSSTTTKPFEKKRTANLENVIGNLKSRKMVRLDQHDDFNNELQIGNRMLSPSASSTPSSAQSFSPNTVSKQHVHVFNGQKQIWSIESNDLYSHENKNNSDGCADSANCTASSPSSSSIRCCDHDSDILKENISRPSSACASETGQPSSPVDMLSHPMIRNKTVQAQQVRQLAQQQRLKTNEKNIEDPTRQIKFYDDYIDFRGDILRRPPGSKNCRILWEYLYTLLQDDAYAAIIRWEDSVQMVFRIVQAEKLAALWGLQKNRLGMTYEKLSRGMRYYYPNNIIAREPGRRLLYRFMRHPNDIKKFVKKNGTYMLKKTKADLKAKKASDKILDIDIDEEGDEDSGLEEPTEATIQDKKATPIITQSIAKSPSNDGKQQHSDKHKNQNLNSKLFHSNMHASNSAASVTAATAAAAAQRFLPNFYPYFTAQMAAAAAAAMQQQPATNFFQRSSNTDDVAAAQFLMQLRNDPASIHQQIYPTDAFKNTTQQRAVLSVTPSAVAKQTNKTSNCSNKKQRPNDSTVFDAKSAYHSQSINENDYASQTADIPQVFPQEQLPLNLSVNSKKRKSKPYILKKELEDFDEFKDAMNDISIKIEN